MEYKERNEFPRHGRAWGAPHRGPRIRFICTSDAIDDPDNKESWTTLLLWNKWRHLTYKDKREAESCRFWVVPGAKNVALFVRSIRWDIETRASVHRTSWAKNVWLSISLNVIL